MKNFSSICIFTEAGRTYTFRNVSLIIDNETVITFIYSAMSDGLRKEGTFYKNRIVGISLTEMQQVL